MKKSSKILIFTISAILVVVSTIFLSYDPQIDNEPKPDYEIDFTYSDIDTLTKTLESQGIRLSSPTEISDHTVKQYCTYFDNNNNQKFVNFCTTTAVFDSKGLPIGNINMGGTKNESILAIALLEISPSLDSNKDDVNLIFSSMIETFVCDCWEEKTPGGFESVDTWIEVAQQRFLDSGKPNLKSKIDGLDDKQVILEISSKKFKTYILTLIVLK